MNVKSCIKCNGELAYRGEDSPIGISVTLAVFQVGNIRLLLSIHFANETTLPTYIAMDVASHHEEVHR